MTSRLIIDFSLVGDLVTHEPLFRHLGHVDPLDLLARGYGRGLFSAHPAVRMVRSLAHPNRGRSLFTRHLLGGERESLGPALRMAAYDEVVVFAGERTVITDFIARWLPQATIRRVNFGGATQAPIRDNVAESIRQLGGDPLTHDVRAQLHPSPSSLESANKFCTPLGRCVGLQLGSNRTARTGLMTRNLPNLKAPPLSMWADLALQLLTTGGIDHLLGYGTTAEQLLVDQLRARLPAALHSRVIARDIPFAPMLGELTCLHSFISCDTGPAHVAAAVGCPLLIFYGPSDPTLWRPEGRAAVIAVQGSAPCMPCLDTPLYDRCRRNVCLESISATAVFAAWRDLEKAK